ncbi:MAG TPA: Ig domain-containing protein [Candidatus Binatia bacterium]|nr:Ig domain-containing protein [Candidatus Binatia bacterium]
MKGLKPFLSLASGFLALAIMAGCAGSVPQNGPGALNIAQFTLADGALNVQYRQLLVATGGRVPYTWSISQGSLPPGLTVSSDGIISGSPTMTGTFNFTATVTDSQTPTAAVDSAPLSITVNPDLTLSSSTLPNAVVGSAYSATITASNGVAPYNYVIAFGSLPDGLTLTTTQPMGGGANSATIGGTPTAAGVFSFTVQVTDSAFVPESYTAAFTITVAGRLQGGYTVSLNGFDSGQPFYLLTSLTASNDMMGNGTITGVLDQNGPGASNIASDVALTGTYSISSSSNFGTIVVQRADTGQYYQFELVLSTVGDSRLIMVDPNNANIYGSGLLKKQPTAFSSLNAAGYAFGLFGNDPGGNRYAAAGTFTINSSFAIAGEEDTNDNGTVASQVQITGGTVTTPDSTGRGTLTLTTASGTTNYVYYVANASETELVAIQTDASAQSIVDVVQQGLAAGGTGGLVLCKQGSTCQSVVALNGVSGGTPVPVGVVGAATFDGSGNIARTDGLPAYFTDQSVGGTFSQVSYTSGTYSSDSSGRITVNLQGASCPQSVCQVWYLVGPGQAFAVGTDAMVMSGTLQPQTGAPFGAPSILGSYLAGTITPVLSSVTNEIDVASTPPPGGIFALQYETGGSAGALTQPASFSGTYGLDPTYGAPLGRFAVCASNADYCTSFMYDANNPPLSIVYVFGGSAGATGAKTGLFGLNLGVLQMDGSAIVDPNPRLTLYGR